MRPDSGPDDSGGLIREGQCPPEELLRAAAAGEVENITLDSLAEHLNFCTSCVQRIESILRDDRLAAASSLDSDRWTDPAADDRSFRVCPSGISEVERTRWVGRYHLGKRLGQGGFGEVYEATDTSLKRIVAIKRLRFELVTPRSLDRFEREARSQASLNHPNIVALHEFGHHQGFPYLVMERIEGEPLSRLTSEGPLAPRATATLMIPVAHAVAHAHHKGLVHRDLKPSNILLAAVDDSATDDDHAVQVAHGRWVVPKIADFGLARVFTDDENATRTEEFAGTVAFMAPELVSSDPKPASPASDIYALGVILYVCLTGRQPFQGQDATSTLAMIRDLYPVMPSLLIPGLPRDLETICMKCLEKEPARRYASADDLADDLQRFLDFRPILARPASLFSRGSRWCRRHPGTAAAISVAGISIVIMAIGGWVTAGIQAELKAEAMKNQAEAQRQTIVAERARISAEKRRALAQSQFRNGTTAIHSLGLTLELYATKEPKKEAFDALRKQFRKELVKLTEQFLNATDPREESPSIMAPFLNTGAVAYAMDGDFGRAETLYAELEDAVRRAEATPDAPAVIRFHLMNAAEGIATAYTHAGERDKAIEVLIRCWNEWPIDPDNPKTPPIMISQRRELAYHIAILLHETGVASAAVDFDKHVAELDAAMARRTGEGKKRR